MEKKISGFMKLLMAISYKEKPIYVRRFGKSCFVWDVIIDNKLYSSYIDIKPEKGRKRLNNEEVEEVTKMCYAGAAATVDTVLGVKLNDKEEDVIKQFEAARTLSEKVN